MSSHCLFSHAAQQHLIKGESNLRSSVGRGMGGVLVVFCDIDRWRLALTCKRCKGKPAKWNALSCMSLLSQRLLQLSNAEKFRFFILYSTVLQNFTRKSRNTVSVREGQAVVLLCGPPPHYGGTALCPDSFHTPAYLSNLYCSSVCCLASPCNTAVSLFVFIPSHLLLNSDTLFSTHFFPYLSARELFHDQPQLLPRPMPSHL